MEWVIDFQRGAISSDIPEKLLEDDSLEIVDMGNGLYKFKSYQPVKPQFSDFLNDNSLDEFTIGIDRFNTTFDITTQVLNLQSQISSWAKLLFNINITMYLLRNQENKVLLVPLSGPNQIYLTASQISQISRRLDYQLGKYLLGIGPFAQYAAYVMADPEIISNGEEVYSSDPELRVKFNELLRGIEDSKLVIVRNSHDGIEIYKELSESFNFQIMYQNELYYIIKADTAEISSEWISSSIERIKYNHLPLWTINGSWYDKMSDDTDYASIWYIAYQAFARLALNFPLLGNHADQIKIGLDGRISFPVVNLQSIHQFTSFLRSELTRDVITTEFSDHESALRYRLSYPDRIIIPLSGKFYVCNFANFSDDILEDDTTDETKIKEKLLYELETCNDGVDPITGKKIVDMTLNELVGIVDDRFLDVRYCFESESLKNDVSKNPITGSDFGIKGILHKRQNSLVVSGVYSGIASGLIQLDDITLTPSQKIVVFEYKEDNDTFMTVNIQDSDILIPIAELAFRENISVEDVRDVFQKAWSEGKIWSEWGRNYYKLTGKISKFPIYINSDLFMAKDSLSKTQSVISYLKSL